MAFTDHEIAKHSGLIEKLLWYRRRPPLRLRDKIREGQRVVGHTIEFFYVRPRFDQPGRMIEESFAKVQYVRSRHVWRLYWMRADGKWHGYPERREVKTLAAALRLIDEDACHCFFG
ncbi:MAG: DUF3024 domain-containing protein [Opitutae bacterium]